VGDDDDATSFSLTVYRENNAN